MVIIAGYMLVDARVAGAVVRVCACDRHGAQPGSCCARAREAKPLGGRGARFPVSPAR